MKIKVCGITTIEQLDQLQHVSIDYVGMIFYEQSKRYAGDKLKNNLEAIRKLNLQKVGVFVNEEMGNVVKKIEEYGLTTVQLHGDETDEYCLELMGKVQVIKVFRIAGQTNIDALISPFNEVCDYYLFDTDTTAYGGSGKKFDWIILEKAKIQKPFFLSGGIGWEDIEKVKAFNHPYFYAIGVNSRFETVPGIKKVELVAKFANQFKA